MYCLKKMAFTLAEVLITLGIIGIVAQMTIPTLISNVEKQTTITSLKKAYSTLSQAYALSVERNGTPDSWGLENATGAGASTLLNTLGSSLIVTKNCGTGLGCFPTEEYKRLNNVLEPNFNTQTNYARAQLGDGSLLRVYVSDKDCNTSKDPSLGLSSICGLIHVDINGFKKPNQWGRDFFGFYITKNGIVPSGTSDVTSDVSFATYCQDQTKEGYSCAAWVLYNENLDYMKCNDLNWNTKTKCN